MSTPITEAHRTLAQSINGRWCSYEEGAQLIADSEAQACAQLRAEVEELKESILVQQIFSDDRQRAERAEAELGKLQELHGCSREMIVHWCAHAAERSLGLDQARAELAAEREKAERYRLVTLGQDAELAAERENVRVLRLACDQICEEWGINHDANPIGAGQRMSTRAGKALEATEDAQ